MLITSMLAKYLKARWEGICSFAIFQLQTSRERAKETAYRTWARIAVVQDVDARLLRKIRSLYCSAVYIPLFLRNEIQWYDPQLDDYKASIRQLREVQPGHDDLLVVSDVGTVSVLWE